MPKQPAAKAKRNGKALLVYFPKEEAERLSSVARERRVAKAELVRVAVGRLLNDLNSGQLELPLGL
jgi:predicted DNA-binding protein